jgi:rhamnulose-1-phosphate aldolase/alcohol dehydrogenase
MVKNRWNQEEAVKFTSLFDQRVYSSRLLGQDSELVMHGGGNTSAKDEVTNILGKKEKVLLIKGSGWDLATIEKPGFPMVKLEHLLHLRTLDSLGDPEMVNELRTHLVDSKSPDPSVEALLHAFLPHRFVDHTHADAILTLTNQPDGEKRVRSLFGKKVGIVPYVMPGFQLAKVCIDVFEQNPEVEAMILLRHGIFTFGDTAKEAYDRMIRFVQQAEESILSQKKNHAQGKVSHSGEEAKLGWLTHIRGALHQRSLSCVLSIDDSNDTLEFANAPDTARNSQKGPLTPDHVIRTKRLPLYVPPELVHSNSHEGLLRLLDEYEVEYKRYFERNCEEKRVERQMLDPLPRVFILPGVGLITAGITSKDANIALDIYKHTIAVIKDGNAIGTYEALGEGDLFDVEYWVLEQAKLKLGPKRLPLTGKIAVVTGAASGIGRAIAEELLSQGANVHVLDIQANLFDDLQKEMKKICKAGNEIHCHRTDVSQRSEVHKALNSVIKKHGGVDIVVVNAGIFPPSQTLENINDDDWNRSIQINLNGAFFLVSEGIRHLKEQASGGDIVIIGSKNVRAPGKEAGSYSVAKAAQTQLARVAALEAGPYGIRVNTLHPHLVFDTALWSPEIIEKRARAYNMTVEQYKKNNLLKTDLSTRDVARATFALVSGLFSKTTGAQIPVDGGSDRTL